MKTATRGKQALVNGSVITTGHGKSLNVRVGVERENTSAYSTSGLGGDGAKSIKKSTGVGRRRMAEGEERGGTGSRGEGADGAR